tara:strand:+ start:660 stop:770 length:111 start_codon:yes stop_codon:yes gene_type:complete
MWYEVLLMAKVDDTSKGLLWIVIVTVLFLMINREMV